MKRFIQILIFIPVVLFQACDVLTYNTFTSYVNTYYDYDNITLSITNNENIRISPDTLSVHREYYWNSTGQNKKTYDSICKAHNDLSYNKKRGYIVGTDWGHCSTFDIVHIDIVSNASFDPQHPSGSLLNDLVYIISVSPKKYIDSGYNYSFDWKNETPKIFEKEPEIYNFRNNTDNQNYCPINEKLSEIKSDMLVMLPAQYFGYLIFESMPTTIKEHIFTVTFTLSSGKTISKNIAKKFN